LQWQSAANYAHHCDTISGAAKAVKAAQATATAAAPCNLTLTDVDASSCGLVATLDSCTARKAMQKAGKKELLCENQKQI